MGKLAIEAVQTRDRELVLSITLIGTLLSLAGYLHGRHLLRHRRSAGEL